MTRLRKFILVIALAVLGSPAVYATGLSSFIIKFTQVSNSSDPDELEDDRLWHRTPLRPIECSISKDEGIRFYSSMDASDILAYEIWDAEGRCSIASFCGEDDFIESLFMQTGEMQIRFSTENSTLTGFASL